MGGDVMFKTAVQFLNDCLLNLFALLPGSPFRAFVEFKDNYKILGVLNFFIPFDICAGILEIWLGAVVSLYIYKNGSKILNLFGLK